MWEHILERNHSHVKFVSLQYVFLYNIVIYTAWLTKCHTAYITWKWLSSYIIWVLIRHLKTHNKKIKMFMWEHILEGNYSHVKLVSLQYVFSYDNLYYLIDSKLYSINHMKIVSLQLSSSGASLYLSLCFSLSHGHLSLIRSFFSTKSLGRFISPLSTIYIYQFHLQHFFGILFCSILSPAILVFYF